MASWVETEAHSGWGNDGYDSVDKNENEFQVICDGRSVDQSSANVGNLEPGVSRVGAVLWRFG